MCDFGLTKLKSELNSGSGKFAGTPCYMAPELFDRKYYDDKTYVFAFGSVLWEIYIQKIPYLIAMLWKLNKQLLKEKNYIPLGLLRNKQLI